MILRRSAPAVLVVLAACAPEAAVELLDLEASGEQRDATCGVQAQQCQVFEGSFRVKNAGSAAMTELVAGDASVGSLVLDFEDDVGDSSDARAPCTAEPWNLAPGRSSDRSTFRMTVSSARAVESDPATYYVALFLPCGDGEAYPTAIERESMLPLEGRLTLSLSGVVDTGDAWTASADVLLSE